MGEFAAALVVPARREFGVVLVRGFFAGVVGRVEDVVVEGVLVRRMFHLL